MRKIKTLFMLAMLSNLFSWAQNSIEKFSEIYSPGYRYGIWYASDSTPVTCSVNTVNGKRSGICNCYYEGKILASTGKYENGLKTGEWKYYWKTGQLVEVVNYKNGLKNGTKKVYYRNGTSKLDLCYTNAPDKNEPKAFYIKDQIYSIENFVNDTLWGKATYYNFDGKVHEVVKYNPGVKDGKID